MGTRPASSSAEPAEQGLPLTQRVHGCFCCFCIWTVITHHHQGDHSSVQEAGLQCITTPVSTRNCSTILAFSTNQQHHELKSQLHKSNKQHTPQKANHGEPRGRLHNRNKQHSPQTDHDGEPQGLGEPQGFLTEETSSTHHRQTAMVSPRACCTQETSIGPHRQIYHVEPQGLLHKRNRQHFPPTIANGDPQNSPIHKGRHHLPQTTTIVSPRGSPKAPKMIFWRPGLLAASSGQLAPMDIAKKPPKPTYAPARSAIENVFQAGRLAFWVPISMACSAVQQCSVCRWVHMQAASSAVQGGCRLPEPCLSSAC